MRVLTGLRFQPPGKVSLMLMLPCGNASEHPRTRRNDFAHPATRGSALALRRLLAKLNLPSHEDRHYWTWVRWFAAGAAIRPMRRASAWLGYRSGQGQGLQLRPELYQAHRDAFDRRAGQGW